MAGIDLEFLQSLEGWKRADDASYAQPLVHEEPGHRSVFENNKIHILNLRLPPGATTQYHIHHTPSLIVFFTSTTTGSQLQGLLRQREVLLLVHSCLKTWHRPIYAYTASGIWMLIPFM